MSWGNLLFDQGVEHNRTGDTGEAQFQARGAADERGSDGSVSKLRFRYAFGIASSPGQAADR
ncbi:hypothetical protein BFX40_12630 [Mesorhizobium sp. SEMIA 3007]|nr:hypothetical protein BFX40_12630 [Mesorhizobium sp. SEMIA 3007]